MENENLKIKTSTAEGPIVPRCLSALPSDIEELLQEFKKQGN